ncbi:MAG: sulfatase [Bacteroidales bacterium]|nr:sulfatase [Bacteroidales bacterium]
MRKELKFMKIFGILGLSISATAQDRPNILYIMSDDHSADVIGAYDSHLKDYVQTPNIDKLAQEGALLTHCFNVNALSAPSRASIISGKYSHKSGVYTLREDLNTNNMTTLPKVMKSAGYQTSVVGKWHIHGDNLEGFDFHAVTLGQGNYFNPTLNTKEGKRRTTGYSSDVITDISLEWLEERDQNQPFFLMTHFKAAHGPWQPAPRHEKMYENDIIPEPATLYDDYANRNPAGVQNTTARIHKNDSKSSLSLWFQKGKKGKGGWPTGEISFEEGAGAKQITAETYQKYVKDYMRCVAGIDENVGRLLAYLEEEGILDNTVIVYTSDQGMYVGEHGFFDKRLGLDEAMRNPFIIRYPKEIEAKQKVDNIVNNVDFAETLIDFAGLEIPEEMQGYSFRSILIGEKPLYNRIGTIYTFYSSGTPHQYGFRTKDFKLLVYRDKKNRESYDLFDMKNDPNELMSLAENPKYKKVLKDMISLLEKEMKEIDLKKGFLPGDEEWKNHVEKGE